ncbi:MAG: efflux RND transporter periplasmic adaptor subunit, partial [Luteolibacter sp.]
ALLAACALSILVFAADLRAAEFALQVIDFEIAQAKASLTRPDSANPTDAVEITAPVSGCVLQLMQESATVVSSGMVILEIGDPGDLEIETEILSRDAVTIQPGDSVEIHQWGGDESLKARVRRIEPAAFTKISALGVEEQRVIVLCDLVGPPGETMRLGDRFRVETQIAIWHDEDVLQAPAGALFRRNNRWHSFVHRGKRAILVEIEAGSSNGRFTQVISGLVQGDQVLLHPPDTVVDGTRITIQD